MGQQTELVESPATEDVTQQQGADAGSPPAEGAKETEASSPLEAVQAALAEDKAKDASQPKDEGGQSDSPEQTGEGKQQEHADSHEEFVKNLSPSKREHWKRLESERDSYKERAQAFDQVSTAVREAGLSGDEFNAGFDIMRTIKAVQNGVAKPADALAKLEPYVAQLRALAGETLPDDLQQRVAEGVISQAEASELSRLRSENSLLQNRITQEQQQIEQQRAQRDANELAASIGTAVTKWEQAWAKSDPDYEVKKSLVKARVTELMHSQGVPRTAEDAVKLSEMAKKDIEQQLGGLLNKRGEVRTVTGGRPSGTPKPAPKNALDVVNQALTASN